MDAPARHLALHAAIVLFFGLACGGPYARAINRGAPAQIVHSWRVAHASLPMGAALMFAVAALLPALAAATPLKWLIAAALIVSSYAFCLSLPLAATVGHRGLSSQGPLAARLVYAGNLLGAAASLIAAGALIWATFISL